MVCLCKGIRTLRILSPDQADPIYNFNVKKPPGLSRGNLFADMAVLV
jgi:hypothetical protein